MQQGCGRIAQRARAFQRTQIGVRADAIGVGRQQGPARQMPALHDLPERRRRGGLLGMISSTQTKRPSSSACFNALKTARYRQRQYGWNGGGQTLASQCAAMLRYCPLKYSNGCVAAVCWVQRLHLADDDHVIAGGVFGVDVAIQPVQAAGDERIAQRRFPPFDAVPLVRAATGELIGNIDLLVRQNIDRESACGGSWDSWPNRTSR